MERAALTQEAMDPQKLGTRNQVEVMMRAAQDAIRHLQTGVVRTTERTKKAMEFLNNRRAMIERQKKVQKEQWKMYSAEAENANKIQQFDKSLMQNLEQATQLEKQLDKAVDERAKIMVAPVGSARDFNLEEGEQMIA